MTERSDDTHKRNNAIDNTDTTLLSKGLKLVRQAGASEESDTDRPGAFSYHAETHAAGLAFGVGYMAAATDDYRYAGALVALAFGVNRGPAPASAKVVEDIKQEPHYAIGGLVTGLIVGNLHWALIALSSDGVGNPPVGV